jgi:arginyl-tRNA synthetase
MASQDGNSDPQAGPSADNAIARRVRAAIEAQIAPFGLEPPIAVQLEVPPRPEFGDLACPIAFELAKRLKKAPRQIALDLKTGLAAVDGVEKIEIAGAGYLNLFFDRDAFVRTLAREIGRPLSPAGGGSLIVEHTNINPNKAAHIGHLRNAILGDTLVRCLRFLGRSVEVQNYIDDTGVQVADLAVGFVEIRGLGVDGARAISGRCASGRAWSETTRHFVVGPATGAGPSSMEGTATGALPESGAGTAGGRLTTIVDEAFGPDHAFDHYCWDLYAEVAPFYAVSGENAARRGAALKEMEEGRGRYAELAAFLSREMVLHHLRTMRWIGVRYDLLPRESDILALGFWERAFELLKQTGAIRLATEGKALGCWVMDLPEAAEAEDEGAKIIVRSNGTVTYVGKDIAYQMWKFGLLGRDFFYRRMDPSALPSNATDRIFLPIAGAPQPVWSSCASGGEAAHPSFGGAARVYNVIDVRQSYLQKVVARGLEALGHHREAAESVHFSYEMVALSPRSLDLLSSLGLIPRLVLSDEDRARPYLEMSGRRGIGVKAEDLLVALSKRAAEEVGARRQEIADEQRSRIAAGISVAALRYYMLRFTRNRVVAFDIEDSLEFEGETGPYLLYAAVRSKNIFAKLSEREGFDRAGVEQIVDRARFASLGPEDALEHWRIVREIARLPEIVEQAVASLELSLLARYVFSVAQKFSAFYHRYPILHETDPARRDVRIALNEIFLRFMAASLDLMGLPLPDRM